MLPRPPFIPSLRMPKGLRETFLSALLHATIRIIPAGMKSCVGYNLLLIPRVVIPVRILLLASNSPLSFLRSIHDSLPDSPDSHSMADVQTYGWPTIATVTVCLLPSKLVPGFGSVTTLLAMLLTTFLPLHVLYIYEVVYYRGICFACPGPAHLSL